jgi:7-carboxy-7-deazaguanine synthase
MLKLNEIFFSIQGESSYVGWPTVFVRTSGCNLRCTYCDTTYAYYEGQKQNLDLILAEIRKHSARHVCITGGEPLLQPEIYPLMKQLCDENYIVSLETSGSILCDLVDPRVKKIIDVKTPDSGAADSFDFKNLACADVKDEFKFVICSEKDFEWSENFVTEHKLAEQHQVYYSPSFQGIDPSWLADKILARTSRVRLQLQLHKYIWSPDRRGV